MRVETPGLDEFVIILSEMLAGFKLMLQGGECSVYLFIPFGTCNAVNIMILIQYEEFDTFFSHLLNYCGNRYGKPEPPKGVMTGDLMIDLDDSSHASGYPLGTPYQLLGPDFDPLKTLLCLNY